MFLSLKIIRKKYPAIDEGGKWGQEARSKLKGILKKFTQGDGVDRVEGDQWDLLCEKAFSSPSE